MASRASSKQPDVSDLILCSISFCDILLYSSNTKTITKWNYKLKKKEEINIYGENEHLVTGSHYSLAHFRKKLISNAGETQEVCGKWNEPEERGYQASLFPYLRPRSLTHQMEITFREICFLFSLFP